MKEVKIIDIDHEGRGIARIDNVVTFVDNALKDEVVKIEITKKNKRYNEAKATEIIESSVDRVEAKCPYFYKCGGCDLMHMSYESQLRFKENKVKSSLKKFANLTPRIEPIIPADNVFYYRNKVEFKVNNAIGFFEKKTNELVKIDECLISDASINELIEKIKKLDLTYISGITIRVSSLKEKMVILETTKDIDTTILEGCSVYLKIADKYIHKQGNKTISEVMNNFTFQISPSAFFQVNTLQAIKLYDKVKEYANPSKEDTILDLYCGTGTIGLYLAEKAKKVYGIEINEDSVKDANINKEINNVQNIEFYALNANQFLTKIKEKIDILILDPPRGGLDKKTIDSIMLLNPLRIVYVSCDVVTLARDLNTLNEKYDILKVTPVDMFPNTHHCESICLLGRK